MADGAPAGPGPIKPTQVSLAWVWDAWVQRSQVLTQKIKVEPLFKIVLSIIKHSLFSSFLEATNNF